MGHFKIENQTAQQVNYDDIASSHGWTGEKKTVGRNGYPTMDAQGREIKTPQTSQEFICEMLDSFVNGIIVKACKEQELLHGKLNYNAAQMIELFKATTSVSWEE